MQLTEILRLQVIAWLMFVIVSSGLFGGEVAASVAYGGFAAWAPVALVAWGLRTGGFSQRLMSQGMTLGVLGFWELIKLLFSVGLLLAAPRVVDGVNWLAVVLAFVLVLKMYWAAALWLSVVKQTKLG